MLFLVIWEWLCGYCRTEKISKCVPISGNQCGDMEVGEGGVRKNLMMNWCYWHKLVSLKKYTFPSIPHSQGLEEGHFCSDEAWLASRPWFPMIIKRNQGSSKKSSKVGKKVPSEAESLEVLKVKWGPIKDTWAGEGAPTGPVWDNLSINKLNGIWYFLFTE